MLKKIWFGILFCSTLFSFENEPFPKIEEAIPEEKDHYRYTTFGMISMAPAIGLGVRSKRGHWGNDFSLSGASFFALVNGLNAQYSRLYYFSKENNNTGYCGIGPAFNYMAVSRIYSNRYDHAVFPSAVVSLGGQFKTEKRIHFIELKGNAMMLGRKDFFVLPSVSYGFSF